MHLAVSTNVPALDVVVDIRGEYAEDLPPSGQSVVEAKCNPAAREAKLGARCTGRPARRAGVIWARRVEAPSGRGPSDPHAHLCPFV